MKSEITAGDDSKCFGGSELWLRPWHGSIK